MNNTGMKRRALAVALVVLVAGIARAEAPAVDCSVEPYAGERFAQLYAKTRQVARRFCQTLVEAGIGGKSVDMTYLNSQARGFLSDFAREAQTALDTRGLDAAADYDAQFEALGAQFGRFDFNDMALPELRVRRDIASGGVEGWFSSLEPAPPRFSIDEVAHCRTLGASCRAIFEDFAGAFNPYRSAYDRAYDNSALLEALSRRWDRFLELSKSQTFIEVWLTTLYHRNHFKQDHLVGPPESQVIALHPHLVYSDMNGAADGDRQELGLALEWIGINFWDWSLPLGISYTTTYVDRAGFDDTGQGVMVHINNHYAIGWAEHGDEDTLFFTIDLLKMLEDKERKYRSYVNSYLD